MTYTETNGWYCITHDTFESNSDDVETHLDNNKPCTFVRAFKAEST